MRTVFWALLVAGTLPAWAGDAPRAERVGVRWEPDLRAALDRARNEGRPVLFALNAIETESANRRLHAQAYPSAAWGDATRAYVALVCNAGDHEGPDGLCERYPGIPCRAHKEALRHVAARLGSSDLISPQHVIFEPDGALAYRKPYYTGAVGPALLDAWLARLAPDLALKRAGIAREDAVKTLLAAPPEEHGPRVQAWLAQRDGLATAAIAGALADAPDGATRRALIAALAAAPAAQLPVLEYVAEDWIAYPEDALDETVAWVATLLALERGAGARAAARAIARCEDATSRTALLRAWGDERAVLALEALALAGDARGAGKGPPPGTPTEARWRIERARARGGVLTGTRHVGIDLAQALAAGDDGAVRQALLHGSQDGLAAVSVERLQALLAEGTLRVRLGVAVAALRFPELGRSIAPDPATLGEVVLEALADPLEGPDARRALIVALGTDPGTAPAAWQRAVRNRVAEEAR